MSVSSGLCSRPFFTLIYINDIADVKSLNCSLSLFADDILYRSQHDLLICSKISMLYKRSAIKHHTTVVRPLVEYASLVWDPHQQTFCK